MQQISFKDWRLIASIEDSDNLRLDVEAIDGSDIMEVGYAGAGGGKDGEAYSFHLSTQKIEEAHRAPARRRETDGDDGDEESRAWLTDEDETIYLRGWEITAVVDEDGLLSLQIVRGEDTDIFEVEPVESGAPLAPRVLLRLAAEESDEDDDDEDDEDELDEEVEDLDEFDELDDGYRDDYEDEGGEYDDVLGEEEDY